MIGNGWYVKDCQRHEMATEYAHNVQKNVLQENLIREENVKTTAYFDTKCYLTVGVGHKVLPEDNIKFGDTIIVQRLNSLFDSDANKYLDKARAQAESAEIYSSAFVAALAGTDYQEGDFTAKNPNTWNQIKNGQYDEAANSLNQGPWIKESPKRVKALQDAIRDLNQ